MKILFFLLLLGNMGFFAWQFTREAPHTSAAAQTTNSDGGTPLVLLSEVDAAMAKPGTTAPGDSTEQPSAPPNNSVASESQNEISVPAGEESAVPE